jgi:hypothetical protein
VIFPGFKPLMLSNATCAATLRRGLMRVATPFVLVAQHDRSFVRAMDVEHVIDVMQETNSRAAAAEAAAAAAKVEDEGQAGARAKAVTEEAAAGAKEATHDASREAVDGDVPPSPPAPPPPVPPPPMRINYVGFPTATTITHAHHIRSKYALHVHPVELPVPPRVLSGAAGDVAGDVAGSVNDMAASDTSAGSVGADVAASDRSTWSTGADVDQSGAAAAGDRPSPSPRPTAVRLLPLVQFYDSMHVASTRWYLSRVFGRRRYINMPRGGGCYSC